MKSYEQLQAENAAIRAMLAAGPEQRLRAIAGVVHVSVGLKQRNGRATDQLCIRVYIRKKQDRSDLPPSQLIPAEINGVATDVNEVGEFAFQADDAQYRPIKGGIRVTNRIIDLNDDGTKVQMGRGTIACLAIDKTDNAPVVLSNWHVLYGNGARNGDKVYQPGPTALPKLDLADLPKRPTDDTDKIGVLRRGVINDKVDAAIAAVDVSSCCHCCGIHYTNEVNGLGDSATHRPARNTIVGDVRAVSGMTVFKAGAATLRSEGVVVDDNHPSFPITKAGTTHTFSGQIAIQAVDHSKAFSEHGDSGAAVVTLDNKIVGLLFAAGKNVPVHGTDQPFVSLANHIGDVFTALNIRIPYAADVVTTAGPRLLDVPTEYEAPIPPPYRALRERLERHHGTAPLVAVGQQHAAEVARLVNHHRAVMVTWRRCQGPGLLASLMASVRDGHYRMPPPVGGVTLPDALGRMRAVLLEHGNADLQSALRRPEADLILQACADSDDLDQVIERIAQGSAPEPVAR